MSGGNKNSTIGPFTRRGALRAASAVATVAAARMAFPGGAFAQAAGPEVDKVTLGFIALTDAAPLIVAQEKGFFAKHGIKNANIAKQASWGATRDNLVLGGEKGGIDGAHILTPMPYLISLGTVTSSNVPVPMHILARLNTDSQAISVAKDLMPAGAKVDSAPLKEVFAKRRAEGKEVKCAMTFRGGTHDMWIRYWLAAGGIDPDKDVSTIVVPPPQMVANMKVGNMDAFCVGEPWGEQLVNQGIGFSACSTGEIWSKHPEKALGMRAAWVDKNPNAAKALLMAVMEAQQWCDKPENRQEMSEIVGRRQWFNVPVADIIGRAKGDINYGNGRVEKGTKQFMKFWQDNASFPFKSHDAWFVTEDIRWGKFEPTTDINAMVNKVNREDLWRDAAKTLGVAAADIPASSSRGKETFFDGKVFDPADPQAYLKSLSIKRVEV